MTTATDSPLLALLGKGAAGPAKPGVADVDDKRALDAALEVLVVGGGRRRDPRRVLDPDVVDGDVVLPVLVETTNTESDLDVGEDANEEKSMMKCWAWRIQSDWMNSMKSYWTYESSCQSVS